MEEKIMDILIEINEDIKNAGVEDNLLECKFLDSFEIIEVVSELEDAFDIEIDGAEVIEENFSTISGIMNLIRSKIS